MTAAVFVTRLDGVRLSGTGQWRARCPAHSDHSLSLSIRDTADYLLLHPGWLVVYRNRAGVLCGGGDDRPHGTVEDCQWSGVAWTVHLTDGHRLPLASIRSVGKTDGEGTLLAAWTVREHGYDGAR